MKTLAEVLEQSKEILESYYSNSKEILESAPPGKKYEKWVLANKQRFIKQYGKKKGLEVLYATAWKMANKSK